MKELNIERFWHDNEIALADPFGKNIPQAAMSLRMIADAMFDELGEPEDHWRLNNDFEWARSLARRYNDLSEKAVGKRFINEDGFDPDRRFPHVKSVPELFGCQRKWASNSWWMMECAHTPAELSALLDRVERLDLRAEMFPDNWESECRRLYEKYGRRPKLGRHLRGPVTAAMSIYGVENLVYLIMDEPALAERFRDVLLRTILAVYRIHDEISGEAYGDDGKPVKGGFSFADDNCAMLTAEMYAFFGQPILKAVFDQSAPRLDDRRSQHSDSDMGHLLPLLAETGMNGVNFGPKVRFRDIRAAMPKAIVRGTLAPYTFMRNDPDQIVAEIRRDLDEARETRGLSEDTAGSVNNGSRLTSLRLVMQTIQNYGRYD